MAEFDSETLEALRSIRGQAFQQASNLIMARKALDEREAKVEAQYKADRETIAAERASVEQARRHFTDYLARKGKALFGPVQQPLPGVRTSAIPLPLRMGPQRRSMLDALFATRDGLTIREIADQTGVLTKVLYTYAQREIAAGIVYKAGDRVVMTEAGRDYIMRATAKFGPAEKQKAPPAEAGGVFQ